MDNADNRRREFAETFMSLVTGTSPTQRIRVVELTAAMNCGRKTFYKYFQNIDDLVIWIVRDALREVVTTEFSSYPQIRPSPGLHDPYAEWPFYTRIITGDRFLDQSAYFKAIALHWEQHRAYYENMFRSGDRCYRSLFDYLVQLYLPALKDDVEYMLDGRHLADDAINFLAEYHAMGLFGRLSWHFGRTRKFIMQDDINPFWNHAHTTMKIIIDRTATEGACCFSSPIEFPHRH